MRVVMICALVLEGFSLVLVLPYYATKGMRKPPSQDLLGRGLSVYTSAGLTPSASSTASRSAGSTSSPWKDNHRSASSRRASPGAASRAARAACRTPTPAWITSASPLLIHGLLHGHQEDLLHFPCSPVSSVVGTAEPPRYLGSGVRCPAVARPRGRVPGPARKLRSCDRRDRKSVV